MIFWLNLEHFQGVWWVVARPGASWAVSLTPIPRGQQVTTGGVLTRDSWSGSGYDIIIYYQKYYQNKTTPSFSIARIQPSGCVWFSTRLVDPADKSCSEERGDGAKGDYGWFLVAFLLFFYLWDREDECLKLIPKFFRHAEQKKNIIPFLGVLHGITQSLTHNGNGWSLTNHPRSAERMDAPWPAAAQGAKGPADTGDIRNDEVSRSVAKMPIVNQQKTWWNIRI